MGSHMNKVFYLFSFRYWYRKRNLHFDKCIEILQFTSQSTSRDICLIWVSFIFLFHLQKDNWTPINRFQRPIKLTVRCSSFHNNRFKKYLNLQIKSLSRFRFFFSMYSCEWLTTLTKQHKEDNLLSNLICALFWLLAVIKSGRAVMYSLTNLSRLPPMCMKPKSGCAITLYIKQFMIWQMSHGTSMNIQNFHLTDSEKYSED